MDDLQQEILSQLPNTDDYLIGFADMHDLLKPHFNYRYAVVIGKKMDSKVMDSIERGPNIVYYNLYQSVNDELNCIVKNIAGVFTRKGIQSQAIPATVHDAEFDGEYSKTLRLKYSHKMAATRSGLGWIGKTDLLISHQYGPRVRLASILTNYQFSETGVPIDESNCGTCQICVDQCPAHAANGKLWNVSIDRNDFYDAFKCRNMCRELSMRNIQKEISLCGICVSVCPIGKKAK
jgi:epoxyqueuosine reductase QueG